MEKQRTQFVILKHTKQNQPVHWDIMLEQEDHLTTFRCDIEPGQITSQAVNLTKIFDHDKKFLTYVGPVNKGLGKVELFDKGTYETISADEKTIKFYLHGEILDCRFKLENLTDDLWRLTPET